MQVRNITAIDGGRYDCEIEHPRFGWIPYTVAADDPEPLGRVLHAEIEAVGDLAMQIDGLRIIDAAGTIAGTRPNGETVAAPFGSDENAIARTGVLGPVAAYVPPVPAPTMDRRRAKAKLQRLAFAQALRRVEMLTHAQVMTFLANGIPAPIAALIAALPEDLREAAEEAMAGAQEFHRRDPLWTAAVAAGALTDAQLDDVFGLTD